MSGRRGLETRAATAADAPGVAALLAASGCPMEGRALAARLAALRHATGTALLAEQWGPPSGLVVLHWAPVLDDARPAAVITTLLVAPDDRRRGIGRLLVKAAAQAARAAGCGRLELSVPPGADGLRAFCEATGFDAAGPRFRRLLRRQG